MKFKKTFLLICLVICLFMMTSVCASDTNDNALNSEDSQVDLSQNNDGGNKNLERNDREISQNKEGGNKNLERNDNEMKNIYVSDTGDDSESGTQTNPYATLHKSISEVNSSDNAVIYVGPGTYAGKNNTNLQINLNQRLQWISYYNWRFKWRNCF